MLSIGKLVAGQEAYYDQQVAQGRDDYYEGKGEAKGEWSGSAATELGLEGEVDAEAFAQLIAGTDPRSGDPLRDTIGTSKVAAFDLTFSAPKSVSVLYALADPRPQRRCSPPTVPRSRRRWPIWRPRLARSGEGRAVL